MELLGYLLFALSVWAHPTNDISNVPIVVEFGPALSTADSYPGRDGLNHIRVREEAWRSIGEDSRRLVMVHEVGHCLGLWDPATFHLGDGYMGMVPQMTAFDRFRVDALHPSLIVRRTFLPMLAQ